MSKEQQFALEAPFPPEDVKSREGSFGKQLAYVEGHTVIRRLNEALQGGWSFEIVEHMIREEDVIVVGRLRVGDVVKMQVGSSRITRSRDTKEIVSLGEDFKAATTDALKKCATMLGVALYLYGGHHPETSRPSPAKATGSSRTPRPSSSGNPSQGRLSQKQHQLILKLAAEAGLSKEELNRQCQQRHGCVADFLSKADASRLIEALFAGQIQAA